MVRTYVVLEAGQLFQYCIYEFSGTNVRSRGSEEIFAFEIFAFESLLSCCTLAKRSEGNQIHWKYVLPDVGQILFL